MSGTAVSRGVNPILTAIPGLAGTYAWPQILVNAGGQITSIVSLTTFAGTLNVTGNLNVTGTISAAGLNVTGTANAANYAIGGTSQFQNGTFVGTLTGVSNTTTGVFNYSISGNNCTLSLANASNVLGTSNAATLTLTGLPAVCQPATQQPFALCVVEDNGLGVLAAALIQQSSTISFFRIVTSGTSVTVGVNAFTASGQKGMDSTVLSYSLR